MKSFFLTFALLTGTFAAVGQSEPCGCESGPIPPVWASVNGVNITELDAITVQRITTLKSEVVNARARELDLQINSKLLELEAARQKKTIADLLDTEVRSKVKQPTTTEVETFYTANQAKLETQAGRRVALGEVAEQIRDHLLNKSEQTAAQAYADKLRVAYGVKKLVEKAPVPSTTADRQKVLATIGTSSVRSADVEDALRPIIYSVQKEVYQARKRAIDLIINDKLLEAEAKKRGVTTKQVYDAEIANKVAPVTDVQAQVFFNENKGRMNGDFATLKPQIIQYLTDEKAEKAGAAFADRLRTAAQIKYFFSVPAAPTYEIPAAGHGSKGSATARLTLTVFTDYQCPTCALVQPDINRILTEYKDSVRLVVYNFPLDMHPEARKAAEAAEAAREQGKFWEYADLLYKNQSQLSDVKLKEYATAVGLDRVKFDAALGSGKFSGLVEADVQKGNSLAVNATPTFFLNGKLLDGFRYPELKKFIDDALK